MLKIQEIREIIRLIDQSSISEFTYKHDGSTVKIKKHEEINALPTAGEPTKQAVPESKPTEPKITKSEQPPAAQQEVEQVAANIAQSSDDNTTEIVSPMVGTFYRKPSPDSETFVEIGDKVKEDSVVCIVEAMKLFNEIEAETNGEIVEILVNDGELVEYGQALFKVKTK